MNEYALRATAAHWDELIQKGIALGILVLTEDNQITATNLGSWDYIGEIHEPIGEVDEEGLSITAPITDENGNPYLHANLKTPIDILELVKDQMPDELVSIGTYFILDEQTGLARLPRQPHRVWL